MAKKNQAVNTESLLDHNKSMADFYRNCAKYKNDNKSPIDTDTLVKAIDGYIEYISGTPVMPTMGSLALYLGISTRALDKYMNNPADERGEVLRSFKTFVSEYHNQAGLTGASNTLFEIYYLKSKMGQLDQPNERTLNINVGNGMRFEKASELAELIEDTPIEVTDYKDMTGNG